MAPKHEPMVMVKELCIDCAVCREVCPYTAVFFVPTKWKIALQVDQARCTGCGGPEHAPCVQFCPSPGALVPASSLWSVVSDQKSPVPSSTAVGT